MKAGDSVWFFDGETIKEFILTDIILQEGYITGYGGHEPGDRNLCVLIQMPWRVFSTREELCEHYRKIFE